MAQINKPDLYFNTKLYTGTGTDNTAITGVGFQPDFTWIKIRSIGYNHRLQDSVRGATKSLLSNTTSAEQTNTDGVLSFDSDGFSLGNDVSNGSFNSNGNTFVSWNWLGANGTSANTDGSITSSVSANTTSGFSIVSYTGTGANATVGHGLGSVPNVIIIKRLDQASNWCVYHSGLGGADHNLFLNTTSAIQTDTAIWNNTLPTTSVFSLGNNIDANGSGAGHIAYCFAEKQGYSKFGSYVGNGSTDGTFIYTGFKPAFVIYKGASGTGTTDNWEMIDNKRTDGTLGNPKNEVLYPNLSNAEGVNATDRLDLLSNGFKMRTSGSDYNASGSTYIYMAFAEQPLVGTNNIPATAR